MKYTKVSSNKMVIFLAIVTVFLTLNLFSITVSAHSPSDMDISYNMTTKELKVTITHQVSNPDVHFVEYIEIKINGEIELKNNYISQPGTSFTYTYENFEAMENDEIKVDAICSQGGSIARQLTVTSSEVSQSDDDNSTPGFEFILLMIAILIFMIVIRKRS